MRTIVCFSAGIHLRPVGAPVRCAASLRLLARERISRYGYSCFLHRVFRERWVAGRSAGPLSGVASFAGPPAVLWFFQAPGARDRTHAQGGSADPAGKRRSRVLMATRRCPPAQSFGLLLRQGFRPSRVPRTPGTRHRSSGHVSMFACKPIHVQEDEGGRRKNTKTRKQTKRDTIFNATTAAF